MLRKIRKRITAQSTAEFAIMLALVIGAVVAMQVYVRRALQARIKGATHFMQETMAAEHSAFGTEYQYEPYYSGEDSAYETNQEAWSRSFGLGSQQINAIGSSSEIEGGRAGWETDGSDVEQD